MVDVYGRALSAPELRRRVATVFQQPNPLPMSIFGNVALPLRLAGVRDKNLIGKKVTEALEKASLLEEVASRLQSDALGLSGGQQQRLCIARALVLDPEVLLFDGPTSSLDRRNVADIEELILSLKEKATLVVISHHDDQVARISDEVFELMEGRLERTG